MLLLCHQLTFRLLPHPSFTHETNNYTFFSCFSFAYILILPTQHLITTTLHVGTSRTKRADLRQICNRSVLTKTDQLQTTLLSAESVFSLLQTLSLNTLRDGNIADAKQTNNRSTDYLQRLQMICNTLKPKKRYNIGETLTAHLLFDT